MERRQITKRPATLKGLSSDRPYPGKTLKFYDGPILVLEMELDRAFPTSKTKAGTMPGFELEPPHFFTSHIAVEQPNGAELELFYD